MQSLVAHKFNKLTMKDITGQLGLMSLQGPKSQDILASLCATAEDQMKVQQLDFARVVYDRVRKRKNYFEIPTFLQIERGKSRPGNSKHQMKTKTKPFLFLFSFDVWNFPTLDFPRSI